MIQQVTQFIGNNYGSNPSKALLFAGGTCALVAAEAGVRVLMDLPKLLSGNTNPIFRDNFSRNLGGAILLGTCALNAIPGIAKVGAVIFAINTFYFVNENNVSDSLYSTQLLFKFKPIANELVSCASKMVNEIAWPIIRAIGETLSNITISFVNVLSTILGAFIPKTPEMFAATAFVAATVFYVTLIKK